MDVVAATIPPQITALTSPKKRKYTLSAKALAVRKEAAQRSAIAKKERARIAKLDEAKVEEGLRKMILNASTELFRSAMIPAMGCKYVYRIDRVEGERGKTIEKHVLLTDPHEIGDALDAIANDGGVIDETFYYITTDKPDFRAIEMLWNRGIGRPAERKQVDIRKRVYSLTEIHDPAHLK